MRRLPAPLTALALLAGSGVIAVAPTPSTATLSAAMPSAVRGQARVSDWPAYGHDLADSHVQPSAGDVDVRTVGRLRIAWAARGRGLSADGSASFVTGAPAVAGGLVVWGDWSGTVHAADVRTGAVRWATHVAGALYFGQVNSSPVVAGSRVFVGTGSGRVVALDRATGRQLWSTVVDKASYTDLFSSPVVIGSKVVIGVSSVQLTFPLHPYTFRGSVVALDVRSGRLLWRTWVQRPGVDGAGGSVWSTAAVDPARGLLYIGTGQAYEQPAGPRTDALLALRVGNGRVRWHRQFTHGDVFNFFGQSTGRDYDIGASPNLFDIRGRPVVGVGDKAGHYAVLGALTGKTVWRRQLCPGSHLGGVMTTAAVTGDSIWTTCNRLRDKDELADKVNRTSVLRLDAGSGRTIWTRSVTGGTVGAVTEAGGLVFVPNTLGTVRAFDARSGRLLWQARPAGSGQRIDHGVTGGITVADDRVLVPYGYTFIASPRFPKNAVGGLVAYRVP